MPTYQIVAGGAHATKEMALARYKMSAMPPPPLDDVAAILKKTVDDLGTKTFTQCYAEATRGKLASMVDLALR
jgi:hypothetical protein